MIRSVLAVTFGYLAMGLVVFAGQATIQVLGIMPPDAQSLTPVYIALNLLFTALGAVFGGFFCGTMAQHKPLQHAAFLAAVVLLLGAAYAGQLWGQPPPNSPPHWYLLTLISLGAPGVLMGGWLQQKRLQWRAAAND